MKDEKIKIYEIGFHLLPIIDEANIPTEFSKIKNLIEEKGGVFISEEAPQMRNLAYTMIKSASGKNQKFNSAYFGWVKFEAPTNAIVEIKTEIDGFENILRYLIINTIRENTVLSGAKSGKFAFGDSEVEEVATVVEEEVAETEEEVEDKKELDNTIEELVIE